MDEENRNVIHEALRLRYKLLPYWYTLFYQSHISGLPVARPLWLEFPRDKNTYNIEDQIMIGSGLMVRPVMDEGANYVQLYLPGTSTLWYDYDDQTAHNGGRRQHVTAPLSKIPLFIRGSHIIPTKQRVRRSSSLTLDDPYTLLIALDAQVAGNGSGQLVTKAWVERLVIIGYGKKPSSVAMETGGNTEELRFSYNNNAKVLTIGRPGVVISTDFTVTIN
ncbi:PREDICTED: neutral alpha-glucosidase AB-like [Amphimedon queenslandica]|uniref:Glycosyl hydrolase family 31 C-terminal domain-containing protein n=1 Tax=Amphimedon queenslandica TaxID=400682 RepID=A0AAN0J8A3_AMPQE|nr:PREDICTED: neutral alpha-glucosidase AB-like [Amphimedon queenslandica]|eukprot:XP_019853250.1 PREDICTED: neutral alpha-glucosidase AB-like [Amphimedon queenslandica]